MLYLVTLDALSGKLVLVATCTVNLILLGDE